MSNTKNDRSMDERCPRKLDTLPCEYCPLAVLRLKTIRNAGKELTEEQESKLPGCQWAVQHQLSNYCFFMYIKDYLHSAPSDKEIAHMNNISVETVKSIENSIKSKLNDMPIITEIKESQK